MPAPASTLRRMAPRQRKPLSAKDGDYKVRFALHLRGLLEERKLTPGAFLARLQEAGLEIEQHGVNHWLRGESMPRLADMPAVGQALRMKDYRKLLPPS